VRNPTPPAADRAAVPFIVALTTHPGRIGSVWRTLRSLATQNIRPERIVLVLAEEEFPGRELPSALTSRVWTKTFEVLWVRRNTRSYKKLLPARAAFPDAVIVTADDDVMYPRTWLARFATAHSDAPRSILAQRAHKLGFVDGAFAPYAQWRPARSDTPSHRVFPTGVGGVLYPPASLDPRVLNVDLALRLAPHGDDIWFRAMAWLADSDVRYIGPRFNDFAPIRGTQRTALWRHNVARNANDVQLRAVVEHFGLWRTLALHEPGLEAVCEV